MSSDQSPQPPEAPDVPRKTQFNRTQKVGVPLIAAIPILALVGLFGEARGDVELEEGPLRVIVEYPERVRYKTLAPLTVAIYNEGAEPLEGVQLRVDRPYLDAFSNVTFVPEPDLVSSDSYIVEIEPIAPGESRLVSIGAQAEHYWLRQGRVTVSADGSTVRGDVSTWIFP